MDKLDDSGKLAFKRSLYFTEPTLIFPISSVDSLDRLILRLYHGRIVFPLIEIPRRFGSVALFPIDRSSVKDRSPFTAGGQTALKRRPEAGYTG